MFNNFAQIGVPVPDSKQGECSIKHGLKSALECLTECSEAQIEKLNSTNDSKPRVVVPLNFIQLIKIKWCLYILGPESGTNNLY